MTDFAATSANVISPDRRPSFARGFTREESITGTLFLDLGVDDKRYTLYRRASASIP